MFIGLRGVGQFALAIEPPTEKANAAIRRRRQDLRVLQFISLLHWVYRLVLKHQHVSCHELLKTIVSFLQ